MNQEMESYNIIGVSVSLRTSGTIYMDLDITLEGDLGLFVKFCADHRNWVHQILIKSQVTAGEFIYSEARL